MPRSTPLLCQPCCFYIWSGSDTWPEFSYRLHFGLTFHSKLELHILQNLTDIGTNYYYAMRSMQDEVKREEMAQASLASQFLDTSRPPSRASTSRSFQ